METLFQLASFFYVNFNRGDVSDKIYGSKLQACLHWF
uniref:Uncharacterized protein n=1 Tax=Rhizophora mucronata TaxID=61149 RepID=A0A2P2KIA2_RHIMU